MGIALTPEEATMWIAVVLGAFVLGGSVGMLVLALLMFAARDADRGGMVPPIRLARFDAFAPGAGADQAPGLLDEVGEI
jgi:hypothetical protein